ncbi:MFS general substrate transporter [Neoconidiobolus thromboides FSU 785]|nr:MFS general substrate transporter [Neoconidiobolus thromboides FSU 785]
MVIDKLNLNSDTLQRIFGTRWLTNITLIAGCLSTTCGGIVYSFSLYGPQVASKLGYTSLQLNLIAIAGNLGVFVSTPYFGYLSDNYPTSSVGLYSTVLYFVGFMLMSLTYNGVLPSAFVLMMIYYFMVGMAGGCAYITATATTGHNFRHKRGFGIGVPVTFFGLSAFLFSLVYHQFFVNGDEANTSGYLSFMAISTSLITFISSRFLIKLDYEVMIEEDNNEAVRTNNNGDIDIGGMDLFYDWDARLLFISILFIGGSGLMYINNVGSMLHTLEVVEKIDNLPQLQALNVSVFSILNCLSRLLFATSSDYLAYHFKVKRTYFLLSSAIILAISQLISGYAGIHQIVICSSIMGIGYGFMFAVAPTLTSVWFGTIRFGINWGWLNIGPALGGQLFSLLFGLIYDSNLSSSSELICNKGNLCYRSSFLITSFFCIVAGLLSIVLIKRREVVLI